MFTFAKQPAYLFPHVASLHALFYKILAPTPTNEIDFGVTVVNHPAIRAFRVRNVTEHRLVLRFDGGVGVITYVPSKGSARPSRIHGHSLHSLERGSRSAEEDGASDLLRVPGVPLVQTDICRSRLVNALVDCDSWRNTTGSPLGTFLESSNINSKGWSAAAVASAPNTLGSPIGISPSHLGDSCGEERRLQGEKSWEELLRCLEENDFAPLDSMPTFFSNYTAEVNYTEEQFRPGRRLREALRNGFLVKTDTLSLGPREESLVCVSLEVCDADVRGRTKIRPIEKILYVYLLDFDKTRLSDPTGSSAKSLARIAEMADPRLAPPPREVSLVVQACKSRMSIEPLRQLNFGSIVSGEQRDKSFTIVNLSEAPLLYAIRKTRSVASGDVRFNAGAGSPGVVRPYFSKVVPFIFAPSLHGRFEEKIVIENRLDQSASRDLIVKAQIRKRSTFHYAVSTSTDFGLMTMAGESGHALVLDVYNDSEQLRKFAVEVIDRSRSCSAVPSPTVVFRMVQEANCASSSLQPKMSPTCLNESSPENDSTQTQAWSVSGNASTSQLISGDGLENQISFHLRGRSKQRLRASIRIANGQSWLLSEGNRPTSSGHTNSSAQSAVPRSSASSTTMPVARVGVVLAVLETKNRDIMHTIECSASVDFAAYYDALGESPSVIDRSLCLLKKDLDVGPMLTNSSMQAVSPGCEGFTENAVQLATVRDWKELDIIDERSAEAAVVDFGIMQLGQEKTRLVHIRNSTGFAREYEVSSATASRKSGHSRQCNEHMLSSLHVTTSELASPLLPGSLTPFFIRLVPLCTGDHCGTLVLRARSDSNGGSIVLSLTAVSKKGPVVRILDAEDPSGDKTISMPRRKDSEAAEAYSLELGVGVVDESKEFALVKTLIVQSVVDAPVFLTVQSNLVRQVLVFANAGHTKPAKDLVLDARQNLRVYVAIAPRLRENDIVDGITRTLVGGLRLMTAFMRADGMQVETTARFTAEFGSSRLAVSRTVLDLGSISCLSVDEKDQKRSSFTLTNCSHGIAAHYEIDASCLRLQINSPSSNVLSPCAGGATEASSCATIHFTLLCGGLRGLVNEYIYVRNLLSPSHSLTLVVQAFVDPGLLMWDGEESLSSSGPVYLHPTSAVRYFATDPDAISRDDIDRRHEQSKAPARDEGRWSIAYAEKRHIHIAKAPKAVKSSTRGDILVPLSDIPLFSAINNQSHVTGESKDAESDRATLCLNGANTSFQRTGDDIYIGDEPQWTELLAVSPLSPLDVPIADRKRLLAGNRVKFYGRLLLCLKTNISSTSDIFSHSRAQGSASFSGSDVVQVIPMHGEYCVSTLEFDVRRTVESAKEFGTVTGPATDPGDQSRSKMSTTIGAFGHCNSWRDEMIGVVIQNATDAESAFGFQVMPEGFSLESVKPVATHASLFIEKTQDVRAGNWFPISARAAVQVIVRVSPSAIQSHSAGSGMTEHSLSIVNFMNPVNPLTWCISGRLTGPRLAFERLSSSNKFGEDLSETSLESSDKEESATEDGIRHASVETQGCHMLWMPPITIPGGNKVSNWLQIVNRSNEPVSLEIVIDQPNIYPDRGGDAGPQNETAFGALVRLLHIHLSENSSGADLRTALLHPGESLAVRVTVSTRSAHDEDAIYSQLFANCAEVQLQVGTIVVRCKVGDVVEPSESIVLHACARRGDVFQVHPEELLFCRTADQQPSTITDQSDVARVASLTPLSRVFSLKNKWTHASISAYFVLSMLPAGLAISVQPNPVKIPPSTAVDICVCIQRRLGLRGAVYGDAVLHVYQSNPSASQKSPAPVSVPLHIQVAESEEGQSDHSWEVEQDYEDSSPMYDNAIARGSQSPSNVEERSSTAGASFADDVVRLGHEHSFTASHGRKGSEGDIDQRDIHQSPHVAHLTPGTSFRSNISAHSTPPELLGPSLLSAHRARLEIGQPTLSGSFGDWNRKQDTDRQSTSSAVTRMSIGLPPLPPSSASSLLPSSLAFSQGASEDVTSSRQSIQLGLSDFPTSPDSVGVRASANRDYVANTEGFISLKGCSRLHGDSERYEVNFGQVAVATNEESLQWTVTLENSLQFTSTEYKVHRMRLPSVASGNGDGESWLRVSRSGGILAANGKRDCAHKLTITVSRCKVDVFQEYVVIENCRTPGDLKIVRVALEVVVDGSDPGVAEAFFSVVCDGRGADSRFIDYSEIVFEQVYRHRSFVIQNHSAGRLEFVLSDDIPANASSELTLSLTNTTLRKITSLVVPPRESRRVFLYYCPRRESLDPDEAGASSVTRLFHVHVSCRLVKDYQISIAILSVCHPKQLSVSSNDFVFDCSQFVMHALSSSSGKGGNSPFHQPAHTPSIPPCADFDTQQGTSLYAENSGRVGDVPDQLIMPRSVSSLPGGAIIGSGVFLGSDSGTDGGNGSDILQVTSSVELKPPVALLHLYSHAKSGQLRYTVRNDSRFILSETPQRCVIDGEDLDLHSVLLRPRLDRIRDCAKFLQKEKYLEEHITIYNSQNPREFFWIRIRLVIGGGTSDFSAVMHGRAYAFSRLEETVTRFAQRFSIFWARFKKTSREDAGSVHQGTAGIGVETGDGGDDGLLPASLSTLPNIAAGRERVVRRVSDHTQTTEELNEWILRLATAPESAGYDDLVFDAHYATDELIHFTLKASSQPGLQLASMLYTYVFEHEVFATFFLPEAAGLSVPDFLLPFVGQLGHFLRFFPDKTNQFRSLCNLEERLRARVQTITGSTA